MAIFKYKNGNQLRQLYFEMQKGSKKAEKEAIAHFAHWASSDIPKEDLKLVDRIYQHLSGSAYSISKEVTDLAKKLWDYYGVSLSLLNALAIECAIHDDVKALKRLFDLGYTVQPIVANSTIFYFAAIYKAKNCLFYLISIYPISKLLRSGKALDHPILIDPLNRQIASLREDQKQALFEKLVRKNSLRSARFVLTFVHPMLRGRYLSDELLHEDTELFELIATSDPDMKSLLRHLITTQQFESADALLTYVNHARPTIDELLTWDLPHDDKGWIIEHLLRHGEKLSKEHYLPVAALQYWNVHRRIKASGTLSVHLGSHKFELPPDEAIEALILAKDHDLLMDAIEKLGNSPNEKEDALKHLLEKLSQKYPNLDLSWVHFRQAG